MTRQGISNNRPVDSIALRVPVILLVLAATAVPIELRSPGSATLDFRIYTADFAANIAGYVPVGLVLAESGLLRAVLAAALISVFAETGQLVMVHRNPSVNDVVANMIGAILGMIVSARWKLRSPELRVNRARRLIAAALACGLILAVRITAGAALNARGGTVPGTLEAHWKFDESRGRAAEDSSGHGLRGRFRGEPARVAGVTGGAVTLDGAKDYIDLGRSTALRLTGSMTISAWINSTAFPRDDAAIVSQFQSSFGYQLDTTIDRGPRTIGFKLTNACGDLMARYGATSLAMNTWYHVAGVYNAGARTLDVYLNGQPDNGFLLGSVTGTQRSSRAAVYAGRRSDLKGFEFAGSIDDVRIYSFALTKAEIEAAMHGSTVPEPASQPSLTDAPCAVQSEPEDAKLPGAAAVFGVLAGIACAGFRPSARPWLCLAVSPAAGLLLSPATASTLPSFNLWALPLLSLAGGVSAALSVRRQHNPDH